MWFPAQEKQAGRGGVAGASWTIKMLMSALLDIIEVCNYDHERRYCTIVYLKSLYLRHDYGFKLRYQNKDEAGP